MLLWQVLSCFLALQLLFGQIISFLFLKIWLKKKVCWVVTNQPVVFIDLTGTSVCFCIALNFLFLSYKQVEIKDWNTEPAVIIWSSSPSFDEMHFFGTIYCMYIHLEINTGFLLYGQDYPCFFMEKIVFLAYSSSSTFCCTCSSRRVLRSCVTCIF